MPDTPAHPPQAFASAQDAARLALLAVVRQLALAQARVDHERGEADEAGCDLR